MGAVGKRAFENKRYIFEQIRQRERVSAAPPAKIVTAQHNDYTGREMVHQGSGITDQIPEGSSIP
jgi:hypothetical protein